MGKIMKKLLRILFRKPFTFKVTLTVLIEKDGDVFYAYSPTLPGLHVEGETEEQVKATVEDAAIAYLESLIKHDDPLPIGSPEVTAAARPAPPTKAYTFTQALPTYA